MSLDVYGHVTLPVELAAERFLSLLMDSE